MDDLSPKKRLRPDDIVSRNPGLGPRADAEQQQAEQAEQAPTQVKIMSNVKAIALEANEREDKQGKINGAKQAASAPSSPSNNDKPEEVKSRRKEPNRKKRKLEKAVSSASISLAQDDKLEAVISQRTEPKKKRRKKEQAAGSTSPSADDRLGKIQSRRTGPKKKKRRKEQAAGSTSPSADDKLGKTQSQIREPKTKKRKKEQAAGSRSPTEEDAETESRVTEPKTEKKTKKQASWDKMFERLRDYKNKQGHCNVPESQDKQLGNWIQYQRSAYAKLKQGKPSAMTEERIQRLSEISFAWKIQEHSERVPWETMFESLRDYKSKQGHCNVEKKQDKKLAAWVSRQRTQYAWLKQGKPSSMTEERIQRLSEISFVWKIQERSERVPWETMFERLKAYKNEFGHTRVPQSYDRKLGTWVHNQRIHYNKIMKGKRLKCPKEVMDRIRLLEGLGFEWKVTDERNIYGVYWDEMLLELKAFKEKMGHTRVPQTYESEKPLASWVKNQRKQFRLLIRGLHSTLTQERRCKLESIDFEWCSPKNRCNSLKYDKAWELMFKKLLEYQISNGHCRVSRSYPLDKKLGRWVDRQRTYYRDLKRGKSSSMTRERIAKLESIGFEWTSDGGNGFPSRRILDSSIAAV